MIQAIIFCINLILSLQCNLAKGATINFHKASLNVDQTCQDACTTSSCALEANHFLSIMNQNINPCDDFYQFVCGNFIKEKSIIDEATIINTFSIAQREVSTQIYNEIRTNVNSKDLSAFAKPKIYYQNCMNESRIENEGTKPLFEILNKIGGWPVLDGQKWNESIFSWENTTYQIRDQNFLITFPVIATVHIDSKNTSKHIIKIDNGFTTISRTFLLDGLNSKLLKAYYEEMINVTVALGADREAALKEMRKVLEFEINLYKIKTPPEKMLDVPKINTQITIEELSKKYPRIPWLKLINKVFNLSSILINNNETVTVVDLNYLSAVEKLIQTTPKRDLANFLSWKLVEQALAYMPRTLRQIASAFTKEVSGTTRIMNRESWCLNEIMEAFPISLSAMYVRKYFNNDINEKVTEILHNVKNQIKKNLEQIDWMDNTTRTAAIEKLQAMEASIGHADELLDNEKINDYYSELEINVGNYLESAFNITRFLENKNYRALRKSAGIGDWIFSKNAAIINAFYILQKNTLEIPAGFLRSFFRSASPQYINYGIIGSIIGHEITHAFDNQGRRYDKNGNENNWWLPSTEEKFFQKSRCIIDQYNNFTVAEIGLQVNGILTQGENIADNGGFKIAYHAYNEWIKNKNATEPCLSSLSYTPRQMFWISAASAWCSKQRPEYLKDLISTDEHSPENARVTISFSNIPEFAKDFNCQIGSKMNPKNKCTVW
ncbi:neprilysin-2 [Nasonia vitripennis]|uniref:Uncharacterized protein n=1 Tax=Nasonia vitripennis TaxID=7425 RepID=A0A7M7QCL9_NASVI|nr:neprilysin-2 [Nasonia vitripennis]